MSEKDEGTELVLDDGTEDSTTGYLNPETMAAAQTEAESTASEEEDDLDDDLDEEDEEDLEEEDDDLEEEEEEPPAKAKGGKKKAKLTPAQLEAKRSAAKKKFTDKTQTITRDKGLIKLATQILSDPHRAIPYLAEKYGVQLGSPQTPAAPAQSTVPTVDLSKVQPNKDEQMPDFIARLVQEGLSQAISGLAQQQPMQQRQPQQQRGFMPQQQAPAKQGFGEDTASTAVVAAAMEYLNEVYDDWQLYEGEMLDLFKANPEKYFENLDALYDDGKDAFKAAKGSKSRRLARKGKKLKLRTGQRGGVSRRTSPKQKKISFDTAWNRAKRDVLRKRA